MRASAAHAEYYHSGQLFSWQLALGIALRKKYPLNKQTIGSLGEQLVTNFLIDNHFYLLHRNWKTKSGELDIIATKARCLHVIEVKTRNERQMFRFPAEAAVTKSKASRIIKLGESYCERYHGQLHNRGVRLVSYDVASVYYQVLALPGLCRFTMEYQSSFL